MKDAVLHKFLDKLIGRGEGTAEAFLNQADRHDRLLESEIQQLHRGNGSRRAKLLSHASSMRFPEQDDRPRCRRCGPANLADTTQEELDPSFPSSIISNRHEPVVIFGAIGLEVGAEVEKRLAQNLAVAKQERNQKPPHTAVAVKKRMDGLKLRVHKRTLYEDGQPLSQTYPNLLKPKLEQAQR